MVKKIRLTLYVFTCTMLCINGLNAFCHMLSLFFMDSYFTNNGINKFFCAIVGFASTGSLVIALETLKDEKIYDFMNIIAFVTSLIVTSIQIFITIGVLQNV